MHRRLIRPAGRAWASALLSVGVVVTGVVVTGVAVTGVALPAAAADGVACDSVTDAQTPRDDPATEVGAPFEELQIAAAQQVVRDLTGREPGAGVRIAVVDSGVREDVAGVPEVGQDRSRVSSDTAAHVWWQGTAVAGIIAGAPLAGSGGRELPVGIAPAAQIYDQRVYDVGRESPAEGAAQVTSAGLADGLRRLLPRVGRDGIRIVNVSVTVARSDELEAAVRAVTDAGAVVVAAAGDRADVSDPDSDLGDYAPGEDYAERIWPAGFARDNPRVVAVTSTAPPGQDVTASVVESSAIDLAVPTQGAVSYAVNGAACSFFTPRTAIAAAEVSGILALLMTTYPRENADQVLARLYDTATGGGAIDPDHPDTRLGRGIVQPVEALTRLIAPGRRGVVERSTRPAERSRPVVVPPATPDVLAATKDRAVWWGLFGGGGLVLALLLRPLLARRRDT